MTFSISVGDETSGVVEGPLDPTLPLVILIPCFGATKADMTAPLSTRAYAAYNKGLTYGYTDAGIQLGPPLTPIAGYFADPPLITVTSWNDALLAAGFSTVSYQPTLPQRFDSAERIPAQRLCCWGSVDRHARRQPSASHPCP